MKNKKNNNLSIVETPKNDVDVLNIIFEELVILSSSSLEATRLKKIILQKILSLISEKVNLSYSNLHLYSLEVANYSMTLNKDNSFHEKTEIQKASFIIDLEITRLREIERQLIPSLVNPVESLDAISRYNKSKPQSVGIQQVFNFDDTVKHLPPFKGRE